MGRKTTIEFSAKMTEIIEGLINSEDAKTISEVVRNSIGLYHMAKSEQKAGNKIAVISSEDDKVIKEIVFQ